VTANIAARVVSSFAVVAMLSTWPISSASRGQDCYFGEADLVLLEGKVITVDPSDSIAEVVAVKNGTIVAVGHNSEIAKLAGPQTQVVHLGGRSVLPAFIDAHTHLEGIAAFHRMLDIDVPPLKGSIELSKLADLIVVSADPLTIPSEQIKYIHVVMTVIDGKIVWRQGF
jgi:predicted amidohydrolase YtcJ